MWIYILIAAAAQHWKDDWFLLLITELFKLSYRFSHRLIMVQMGRINKTKTDLIGLEMHCRSREIAGLFVHFWLYGWLIGPRKPPLPVNVVFNYLLAFDQSWARVKIFQRGLSWRRKWLLWQLLSRLRGGHKHKGRWGKRKALLEINKRPLQK